MGGGGGREEECMKNPGGALINQLTYIADAFYGEKVKCLSKKCIDTLKSSINGAYKDKFQF